MFIICLQGYAKQFGIHLQLLSENEILKIPQHELIFTHQSRRNAPSRVGVFAIFYFKIVVLAIKIKSVCDCVCVFWLSV